MATSRAGAPESLSAFLSAAPAGTERVLTALAGAVTLTDALAEELLNVEALRVGEPSALLEALRAADFVVPRNSEWQFGAEERTWLSGMLADDVDLRREVHSLLAARCDPEGTTAGAEAGPEMPSYLRTRAGLAYHTAALESDEGLRQYAGAFGTRYTGEQWLLGVLAEEQQDQGILPPSAIEPSFLRGMSLYREGNRRAAYAYLNRVVQSDEERIEVAIALHLVGLHDWRVRRNNRRAESLFRRSVDIGRAIDARHHVAQVLHSLARVLQPRKWEEALSLLENSLTLLKDEGDLHGEASVLHSLGRHLLRRRRREEALRSLRESVEVGRSLDHQAHTAQALHTLGMAVGATDYEQAQQLLLESLEIERSLGDPKGIAKVLSTMGNVARLAKDYDAAELSYREVLSMSAWPDARVVAELGMSYVAQHAWGDILQAVYWMELALESQRRIGGEDHIRRHIVRLRKLRHLLGE